MIAVVALVLEARLVVRDAQLESTYQEVRVWLVEAIVSLARAIAPFVRHAVDPDIC